MKPIIATLILLSLPNFIVAQKPQSKYCPAPAGAQNVRTDQFTVIFKQELSEEQFDQAIARIVKTYRARIVPSDAGRGGKMIFYSQRLVSLYISERVAKRIAKREESVQFVRQEYSPSLHIS